MNIQLIGIDEDTFQAASEEGRISWAKENTTAGFGLCCSAIQWLKSKNDNVQWYGWNSGNWYKCDERMCVASDGFIYRLAPDYQPPVKPFRWLFNPTAGAVIHTQDDYAGMIEVTEDFAKYIQNKPDEEWELRIPNGEDDYISYGASDVPPYRWCKPKVKRWWFHPCSIEMLREMETACSVEQPDHSPGWIEVSEDFARYVQNKPDCECELRIPNEDDDYISYGASDVPTYRWCKPRKSEPPRYSAGNYSGINYVWDHKGRYAVCHGGQMQDMHRIAKAMNALEKSRLDDTHTTT